MTWSAVKLASPIFFHRVALSLDVLGAGVDDGQLSAVEEVVGIASFPLL
jgi:hypothetical protein